MWRITRQIIFLFLTATTASCLNSVGQDPDTNAVDPIRTLKYRLSEVRGLAFKAEVPIVKQTKEGLNNRLAADLQADMGDRRREDLSLAYVKLGLLPRGVDLRSSLLSYYSSQAQGYYNSTTKEVVLLEGQNPLAMLNSSLGEGIDARVLVHELTHALQDQHFSLAARLRPSVNGDQMLALRSVAEADAILSEYAYLFGGLYDWVPGYARAIIEADARELVFPGVPAVIADKMRFQYSAGLKFVSNFMGKHGWLLVNLIHTYPPLSTEQILHPEKYLSMPDPPTDIRFKDLAALFSGEWREIENDTLGELMVQCLFKQFLGSATAAVIAKGWDGDRLVAYRRGDEVAFIWATTWDSARDAQEFFDGYQRIVSMKYDAQPLEQARFYIEKRDQTVLIVEGLDREYVKGLVENVWRGVEIKEAPFQLPPLASLTSLR
jgi:hypothetical protein